jgi:hypothetical protein
LCRRLAAARTGHVMQRLIELTSRNAALRFGKHFVEWAQV